jgi:hypothetical protein
MIVVDIIIQIEGVRVSYYGTTSVYANYFNWGPVGPLAMLNGGPPGDRAPSTFQLGAHGPPHNSDWRPTFVCRLRQVNNFYACQLDSTSSICIISVLANGFVTVWVE